MEILSPVRNVEQFVRPVCSNYGEAAKKVVERLLSMAPFFEIEKVVTDTTNQYDVIVKAGSSGMCFFVKVSSGSLSMELGYMQSESFVRTMTVSPSISIGAFTIEYVLDTIVTHIDESIWYIGIGRDNQHIGLYYMEFQDTESSNSFALVGYSSRGNQSLRTAQIELMPSATTMYTYDERMSSAPLPVTNSAYPVNGIMFSKPYVLARTVGPNMYDNRTASERKSIINAVTKNGYTIMQLYANGAKFPGSPGTTYKVDGIDVISNGYVEVAVK